MLPGAPRPKAIKIKAGCFAEVIRKFLTCPKFGEDYEKDGVLAKSTQTTYKHLLGIAERPDVLGAVSIHEIRPALVQAFLDGFADRPATQKNAQTAMKAVERWAIVRDLLPPTDHDRHRGARQRRRPRPMDG
jgi:hypothetical protein